VRHTHRARASTATALADAGFSVVSFAGNHCLDWGPDGLFDTIDHLRAAQLEVVGVGRDIAQARRPVIVTRPGRTRGFSRVFLDLAVALLSRYA
jgi:poly-gamma-glutamate capsule biosynthesis protein CapA/YwtB (metallophosphatase superfamily)